MTVNRISPEKSDATILYGKHLVDNNKLNVILRLKLRDEHGRNIPNRIIQEMKCNFSRSYIENSNENITDLEVKYLNNDIIYLVYSFETYTPGKYTFIPKIICEGDEYDLTLKCSETEDDENSIYDKCAFYVNPGSIPVIENLEENMWYDIQFHWDDTNFSLNKSFFGLELTQLFYNFS